MAFISNYMSDHVAAPFVMVDDKEIRIIAGQFWLKVSREEAAQLAVDLLNAAEAVPADVQVAA